MSNQPHRTCIRMSEKEYQALKDNSKAVGLSANAWLMRQLETNWPVIYREEETAEVLNFMDEVGQEVNDIARDFNSGYGTASQLQFAVQRLMEAQNRIDALRKKGYPYAP